MYSALIGFQQEVIESISVLRSDPLLYLVVVLPLFGILGLGWLYRVKHQENKELRGEISGLIQTIMESNRLATEAITSQVEVMRSMKQDQRDALNKYEVLVLNMGNDIKQAIKENRG